MENSQPSTRISTGLLIAADMLDHRGEISLQVGEKPGYLVKALFDSVQPGRRYLAIACGRFRCGRRPASFQDRLKVLRLPAERHRQRFQSSWAAAALDGVTLNFAHDGGRYMRALCKFALTPSKLGHAPFDDLGDCRPIFRHAFPPRSAVRAEISRSPSFHGSAPPLPRLDSANSSTRRADFIEKSMKSAITVSNRGLPAEGQKGSPHEHRNP
jgi:hypothetical protein